MRRAPAVGGDRHRAARHRAAPPLVDRTAGRATDVAVRRSSTIGSTHDGCRRNSTPAGRRLANQRPIEIGAPDRAARRRPRDIAPSTSTPSSPVTTCRRSASRTPRPPRASSRRRGSPARRDSACRRTACGGGTGAIDQRDARAGAREHGRGDRTGRSGAGDDDVIHADVRARPTSGRHDGTPKASLHSAIDGRTLPITIALFFDPKPRQLQSAASTCAARPTLGMKSRSHAGSGSRWLIVGGRKPRRQRQRRRRRCRRRRSRPADGRSSTSPTIPAGARRARRTPGARSATRRRRSAASTCRGS